LFTTTRPDAETIAAFRPDGTCALRRGFASLAARLRAGVVHNLAEPSAGVKIYQGRNGSGRFIGGCCN
jgi:hypothetical protein